MAGIAKSVAEATFQAADTDHNGSLSKEEWKKALEEPANVAFNILDGNHDGQITQQEAQQAHRVIVNQIRSIRIPQAANAPSNLIRTRRLPSEVAPVPTFGTQNRRQQGQPAPAQPAPPQ
jgi:hypothetical protein